MQLSEMHARGQSDSYSRAALVGVSFPGIVDQHASHHVGGNGVKMGAAFALEPVLPCQPQIGFVNQGGGLKGAFARFNFQAGPCEP